MQKSTFCPFCPFSSSFPAIRCPARMALEWLLARVPLDTRAILLGYPSQSSLHRSASHIALDTELQESTYSRAHLYKVLDLRIKQTTKSCYLLKRAVIPGSYNSGQPESLLYIKHSDSRHLKKLMTYLIPMLSHLLNRY